MTEPSRAAWPRKILCPIDFSEGSREAVRVALDLARLSGGGVTLYHAYDLPLAAAGEGAMLGAATLERLDRDADEGLRRWQGELARPDGPPIAIAKGLGGEMETITGHARTQAFDLIVIGTHGRTGLKRALLGSVAENVVRHAPCPVLVVRRHDKG